MVSWKDALAATIGNGVEKRERPLCMLFGSWRCMANPKARVQGVADDAGVDKRQSTHSEPVDTVKGAKVIVSGR